MLSKDAKILVVDDSRVVRLAMKKLLSNLEFTNIVEAGDGQEAVEKHQSEKPALIIMDIIMPNMNGDEALEKIREQDKDTPVIILSSFAKEQKVERCRELGIEEFITKPFSPDKPEAIEKILESL